MDNEILKELDSIELGFIRLKHNLESKDDLRIENTIDGFGNGTMQSCLNYFGEGSELYKSAQKIYEDVLTYIYKIRYRDINETIASINSLLFKIRTEKSKL